MIDKIIPTYERSLEIEDFGLAHSKAHCAIAVQLMLDGDLDAAKPHAVEAAEAFSARALITAARVCELREELDEADKWYGELSRNYPSYSGLQWYLFRLRTGEQDLDEPRRLALHCLTINPNWKQDDYAEAQLAYAFAERDDKSALEACQFRAQKYSGLYSESFLLIAAMQAGDDQLAAASQQRLFALCHNAAGTPGWAECYRGLLQEVLAAKAGDENADEQSLQEKADEFLNSAIAAEIYKADRCYFVGKLLRLQGYNKAAAHCFRLATTISKTPERITWRLASIELQQLQ